jgi:hypothetical protein
MSPRLEFLHVEKNKTFAAIPDFHKDDEFDMFDHYLIGALSSSPSLTQSDWESAVRTACACVTESSRNRLQRIAKSQEPKAGSL